MRQALYSSKPALVIAMLISVYFLSSCKKLFNCETWEYKDKCQEKIAGACSTPYFQVYDIPLQAYLCDDKLNGVYAGYSFTRTDDNEKTVTRTYTRKIN